MLHEVRNDADASTYSSKMDHNRLTNGSDCIA